MKNKNSFTPIIPLPFDHKDIAIPKELIIDYDNNNIYITNNNGELPDDLIEAMRKRLRQDQTIKISDERVLYGINIESNDSDPEAVTYTDDSTEFTELKMIDGYCSYGSWEDIINDVFGITPVLMEDGKEILELNPDDYNRILDHRYGKYSIFGFELDMTTGVITYTDDAVDRIPVSYQDGKFDYGDFKSFIIDFLGVKPTALDNGDELYDLDPYHYTNKTSQDPIEDNNMMIRFKHNYYYIGYEDNGNTLIFKVANYNPDETIYVEDAFKFGDEIKDMYVSAYEFSKDAEGNFISKSGVTPIYHDSSLVFDEVDMANKYLYLALISMLICKDVTMEGLGYRGTNAVYDANTGSLDSSGFFSSSDDNVKSYGAENLLGNGGNLCNSAYANGTTVELTLSVSPNDDVQVDVNNILFLRDNYLAKCNKDCLLYAFGNDHSIIVINMAYRLFL